MAFESVTHSWSQACSEELEKLCQSRHLRSSNQLKSFLRFVVQETLAGREAELKEYTIGRAVFHRGADYDPRLDSVVRVQASQLRKKLEAYYSEEGASDPLIIELPKGSYVPRFRRAAPKGETARRVWPGQPKLWGCLRLWRSAAAFAAGVAVALCATVLWPGRGAPPAEVSVGPYHTRDLSPLSENPLLRGALTDRRSEILLAYGVPRFYQGGDFYIRDVSVNAGTEAGAPVRLGKLSQIVGAYLEPDETTYTGTGELSGVLMISHYLVRPAALVLYEHQAAERRLDDFALSCAAGDSGAD